MTVMVRTALSPNGTGIRPATSISDTEVAKEWDNLAPIRLRQIRSKSDITYNHVIKPIVLSLVRERFQTSVIKNSCLDVGCGVGDLTDNLSVYFEDILGIDLSEKSLELAAAYSRHKNTRFLNVSLAQLAKERGKISFECVVASMSLQCMRDINRAFLDISKLISDNGIFLFVIPHPCFWPEYSGYAKLAGYDYGRELAVTLPFRITREYQNENLSTQFHRPLQQYFSALQKANFVVEQLIEIKPELEVETLYPTPWVYPRYISVIASLGEKSGLRLNAVGLKARRKLRIASGIKA
jgi:2-polyprenyl-3-methyl-5-hydroxy-6-metoxy-1,4-benzoquinol methylase